MLQHLTIDNIAVIKQAQLDLPAGFVALTGETGAGKSIVIDAINAVLGVRTSRDLIRTGAETARVSALFGDVGAEITALLHELDLPEGEDGSVLVSRVISHTKNSCRVNGMPVTVATLRQLGQLLINVHGQHDNQALLDPARHVHFVDAIAENEELRKEYRAAFAQLRALQRQQDALQMDEDEKARRLDMLAHQIDELELANVQLGERETLRERQTMMRNSEKIAENLQMATTALLGDEASAVALAFEAISAIQCVIEYLPAADELAERLQSAVYELQEGAADLRSLFDTATFDPAQADEVQARLDVYHRLSRKYGDTEAQMLAFLESARAEQASITQSDERILQLEEEIDAQLQHTIALAKQLAKTRRAAGEQFSQQVVKELTELDMPSITFTVQFTKIPLRPEGGETAEFLISANLGESPKPLAKVASGGELSRIMLAIKAVLAAKDCTPTLIFDEIDAGVSGRAAQKIGRKLRQVAQGRQVICVTHLAQIAALADCHLHISKHVQADETHTRIALLDHEGRRRELARIMGGEEITPAQLAAADDLLFLQNK
ncbi:MAG: DNA repair protein RecN [Oscillospiraceae bacterium]|nr:DNA repair protein RecN [Oscillospiraceae bacterium]